MIVKSAWVHDVRGSSPTAATISRAEQHHPHQPGDRRLHRPGGDGQRGQPGREQPAAARADDPGQEQPGQQQRQRHEERRGRIHPGQPAQQCRTVSSRRPLRRRAYPSVTCWCSTASWSRRTRRTASPSGRTPRSPPSPPCPATSPAGSTRALEDPTTWTLVTEWESVGAYRRALGDFDVKVHATPLLAESLDEPSAFETLAGPSPAARCVVTASDRAAEPVALSTAERLAAMTAPRAGSRRRRRPGPGVHPPFPAPPVEGRGQPDLDRPRHRRAASWLLVCGGGRGRGGRARHRVMTSAINEQADVVVSDYLDALQDERFARPTSALRGRRRTARARPEFTARMAAPRRDRPSYERRRRRPGQCGSPCRSTSSMPTATRRDTAGRPRRRTRETGEFEVCGVEE